MICGFARTGEMWGSQTYGIKPDMLTTAKALSAAMQPISAVLINERVHDAMLKPILGWKSRLPEEIEKARVEAERARLERDLSMAGTADEIQVGELGRALALLRGIDTTPIDNLGFESFGPPSAVAPVAPPIAEPEIH